MKKMIYILIIAMTIMDAFYTVMGVKAGYIEEGNPILSSVFNASPEIVALLVVAWTSGMLYLIYRLQHRVRWINFALGTLFVAKAYVIYLHYSWITSL